MSGSFTFTVTLSLQILLLFAGSNDNIFLYLHIIYVSSFSFKKSTFKISYTVHIQTYFKHVFHFCKIENSHIKLNITIKLIIIIN